MAELNPVLAFLLNRRSCHKLSAPGPDDGELALIIQAGLRAPDFQSLRPYRFLCAREQGLHRLGAALHDAAHASGQPEPVLARAARMPLRAPLVITVVASPKSSDIVPVFDQQLCAGSSVLMMQLAARALGYNGVWRSGWPMYNRHLHQRLGLSQQEQIVGFLYLGTNTEPERALAQEQTSAFIEWI